MTVATESRVCEVGGCGEVTLARGVCRRHYPVKLKTEGRILGRANDLPCDHVDADGTPCGRPKSRNRTSLCSMHYGRKSRGQEMDGPARRAKPGSGTINASGYRVVTVDNRQVLEHRLIMEEHLGRALWPDENVHHINGDRADNRLGNLEVWSTSQPAGQRIPDKVAHAVEMLRRYAPTLLTEERFFEQREATSE